jgi:ABC-type uncharacterized transport system permease subunit
MDGPALQSSNAQVSASFAQQSASTELQSKGEIEPNPPVGGTELPLQLQFDEPKQKKSLAFKLAFVGLAATLFVFQMDATALGIALPVSGSQEPTSIPKRTLY